MKNLAIIPARGGSKRIPHKNIRFFLGKPIIAYSIEAALATGLFSEVMVSTDDEKIANISRKFGAKVPQFRSAKTADDHATISDVMMEVLECYEQKGKKFDHLCCLFATAPLVTPELLQKGYDQLLEKDCSTVVSVQQYSFPILRSLKINESGYLEMNWPEHAKTRSQDLPEAYHDAGQFYWAKVPDYLKEQRFYSKKAGYLVLEEMQAQDIDTEEDWHIAEFKYQITQNHG